MSAIADSDRALRVLVVDDEPGFARSFARRLELMGFEVDLALNREEALKSYRDHDVLFIDMSLGAASGLDVARQIFADQEQKWIFLMSAHEDWLNRSVRSDLPTLGSYAKPIEAPQEDDIRSQLGSLQERKARRDVAVAVVAQALHAAAGLAGTNPIEAQLALSHAKRVVETELLPVTRRRKGRSGTSSRRAITLQIWAALTRLSFVPSEQFDFTVPDGQMLTGLATAVAILGKGGLSENDEMDVDRILRAASLSIAPGEVPLERPDLTVDPASDNVTADQHTPVARRRGA